MTIPTETVTVMNYWPRDTITAFPDRMFIGSGDTWIIDAGQITVNLSDGAFTIECNEHDETPAEENQMLDEFLDGFKSLSDKR